MSLDVYVMPIWKFKAGDFSSPLDTLGFEVTTIAPGGVTRRKSRDRPGFITCWKAKRATRLLKGEILGELGCRVTWTDEGEMAYSEQAHGFEALQAYAKWLDCRNKFPSFDPPPGKNFYKHPVLSVELDRPLSYPQIVDHSCYSGYFIPAEFEQVVFVEPFTSWGGLVFKHSVGSCPRLYSELDELAGHLQVDEEYAWDAADPLNEVKEGFSQLLEVARISREKNLPIIFHG